MAGGLTNYVPLAAISTSATSFRLNAGATPPTTYANAVSSTIGSKAFVAGSGFLVFTPSTGILSAAPFSGAVTPGGGLAAWFSLVNDTLSQLLATAGLIAPVQIGALENNFYFSTGLTLVERVSAPTLTSS